MFANMQRLYPRGSGNRGIAVDAEGAMLGPDCVLVRRTAQGYRCIAPGEAAALQQFLLGNAREPDWLFGQCRRIAKALDGGEIALSQILGLYIPVTDLDGDRLKQLAAAAPLIRANFNPDEPRIPKGNPDGGQWTTGGGDGAGARAAGEESNIGSSGGHLPTNIAPAGTVVAAEAAADSLLGEIGGARLASLARLAAGMSAPTLFLGILFIPFNHNPLAEGKIENAPRLTYRYDRDTGIVRIWRDGAAGGRTLLGRGHIDAAARFRDAGGHVIGRLLPGGAVIVDPDRLPGYRAQSGAVAGPRAAAQAGSEADTEPKLCPDPNFDHPGARSKDIAYQHYVSTLINGRPLPPGLAVSLWNPISGKYVHFDDCRLSDGTMIDAKGTGYLAQLSHGAMTYPWLGIEEKMRRQARAQIQAAQGRPIEWHFAEREVADYVRALFEHQEIRIHVIYTPWQR
jgi:hypothetical protein